MKPKIPPLATASAAPFPETVAAFRLDDEAWAALQTALAAPSEPMPRLERLMREPGVLEAL
jgi:uncharacterized protein (DUF1778 family)